MLDVFFPVLMYTLGSILLVILIVLGIKMIQAVDKANALLDDVTAKTKSLDNMFVMLDNISNTVAIISDKVVDGVTSAIASLFHKVKKRKSKEEEILEEYE